MGVSGGRIGGNREAADGWFCRDAPEALDQVVRHLRLCWRNLRERSCVYEVRLSADATPAGALLWQTVKSTSTRLGTASTGEEIGGNMRTANCV